MLRKLGVAGLLALVACAPAEVPFPAEQVVASKISPNTATALTKSRPDTARFTALVLRETNAIRREANLPPLVADLRLIKAAQMQARNMARDHKMNHYTSAAGEQTPRQRMAKVGLHSHFAENIARNFVYDMKGAPVITRRAPFCHLEFVSGGFAKSHDYESMAKAVVDQWVSSPGHRKNIMNPVYRRMGAGFTPQLNSDFCGDVYLAQTFAD